MAALDVPDAAQARVLARTLAPHVGVLKVGLELFIAEGPALVRELAELRPIFLDLKLHDIPATVARAAAAAARLGVRWLTVHPGDEAVRAAVQAAPDVRLLLVT
ncbi:MAG: orotidine 5'-phosphate decarboxylase, partial [Myxococcales bacterium]|nr:orotidine 5'-phosphate decarboxylase [Myxococcales bacterium]